ncbi:PspC domain-containing protein [Blastococcus deserti]|uniref:PspC domain-containing protein n=1 Tax=Blastococcus deserti TaxID=2259033 RepID=A0ABW4XC38_9ACTN
MTNAVPPTPPTDQPTWQQPPPPIDRPQLRRSSTDSMLGGVSGGLAEYSGIDAVLWRVGFVGLTLAGGAGVVLYLLLWVLMPPAPAHPDRAPSPLEQLVGRLHAAINGSRATPPQG